MLAYMKIIQYIVCITIYENKLPYMYVTHNDRSIEYHMENIYNYNIDQSWSRTLLLQ
jgi:hypothetical protein